MASSDCLFMCLWCSIDGVMRTMNTEKLIKTLPIIQNQLDALLDFQVCDGEYACMISKFPRIQIKARFIYFYIIGFSLLSLVSPAACILHAL